MTNDEIEAVRAKLLTMYSHRGDGIPTQFLNPDGQEAVALINHLLARAEQAETECDQARAGAEIWKDRAEQAERERDGCKIMAEGFKDQLAAANERVKELESGDSHRNLNLQVGDLRAQLAARDAAIAESLRRAVDPELTGDAVEQAIEFIAEPLRQIKQPEPCGISNPSHHVHLAPFNADHHDYQPEPDKLVEAVKALQDGRAGPTPESYAACLRNEVEARGGRVVFDGEGE